MPIFLPRRLLIDVGVDADVTGKLLAATGELDDDAIDVVSSLLLSSSVFRFSRRVKKVSRRAAGLALPGDCGGRRNEDVGEGVSRGLLCSLPT